MSLEHDISVSNIKIGNNLIATTYLQLDVSEWIFDSDVTII